MPELVNSVFLFRSCRTRQIIRKLTVQSQIVRVKFYCALRPNDQNICIRVMGRFIRASLTIEGEGMMFVHCGGQVSHDKTHTPRNMTHDTLSHNTHHQHGEDFQIFPICHLNSDEVTTGKEAP